MVEELVLIVLCLSNIVETSPLAGFYIEFTAHTLNFAEKDSNLDGSLPWMLAT